MSVGLFGPERLQWVSGGPVRLLPVYVFIKDTSNLAVLYADPNGLTTIANPTWTDHNGELTFFAELGEYDLWANDAKLATIQISDSSETVGVSEEDLVLATRYVHQQVLASDEWLIDHTLGYNPAGVAVVESTGDSIMGAHDYPISNQRVRISFASPCSGVAYLS
jgi:hypothetical protein